MKKSFLFLLSVLLLSIVVYGCYHTTQAGTQTQTGGSEGTQTGEQGEESGSATETEQQGPKTVTVEITAAGFSPTRVTINAGDTVTFTNKDTRAHWPASAVHPTHTKYPGSGIGKCGTAEQSTIFDACKGLAQGESWSFTFNVKGSHPYHNHLAPSIVGVIEVV